jgi:hypothetical protein
MKVYGGMDAYIHVFLTSTLLIESDQLYILAALTRVKSSQYQ